MMKKFQKWNGWKKKKKFVIPISIIGLVLIVALVLSQYDNLLGLPQGTPVSTGTVEVMDVREKISVRGTVEGEKSAELTAVGGYQILEIRVEEGDLVEENQVLLRLDPGASNTGSSQGTTEAARVEYMAAQKLYQEGAISHADYLRAKGAYESALSLSANTVMKSPFEGTVTRVNGVEGGLTETGVPVVTVEDLSRLKMKVSISEYDIRRIKVGQPVEISAEILGEQTLMGEITHISPTGERKDPASTEMVIPVTISIDKEDSVLISGVTAKGDVIIQEVEQVTAVPVDAILEDPATGETFVFVLRDGFLAKIPVKLGVEGDFNIQVVTDELNQGDVVVLSPTMELEEGTAAYDMAELLGESK
jgi:RND family efflux transporter MFP subunit